MQYIYRYTFKNKKSVTEIEFNDFFDAIHFLNKHVLETANIEAAVILNAERQVVYSKGTIQ